MNAYNKIIKEFDNYKDLKKGEGFLKKFFKAYDGGYAEGDKFLGLTVPVQRKIAKKYQNDISLDEIRKLLYSEYHEHRLTAVIMLVHKFKKVVKKEEIYRFYLKHRSQVNNWDIVDSSAHYIIGDYLKDKKDRTILDKLAKSKKLWDQRIAMIATYNLLRDGQFDDTFRIAELLLNNKHDLIHKAVGWMLRELGKKDQNAEERFLKKHYKKMPRTMLRYAIEQFDETKRKAYLDGKI